MCCYDEQVFKELSKESIAASASRTMHSPRKSASHGDLSSIRKKKNLSPRDKVKKGKKKDKKEEKEKGNEKEDENERIEEIKKEKVSKEEMGQKLEDKPKDIERTVEKELIEAQGAKPLSSVPEFLLTEDEARRAVRTSSDPSLLVASPCNNPLPSSTEVGAQNGNNLDPNEGSKDSNSIRLWGPSRPSPSSAMRKNPHPQDDPLQSQSSTSSSSTSSPQHKAYKKNSYNTSPMMIDAYSMPSAQNLSTLSLKMQQMMRTPPTTRRRGMSKGEER